MQSKQYQEKQLNSLLESRIKENFSGIIFLKTAVQSWKNQRNSILIFNQGEIVYSGLKSLNNHEFAETVGKKIKPDLINAALSVAISKLSNPNSVGELIDKLVTLKVFTWKDLEKFTYQQVVAVLEKFVPHPGEIKYQENSDFDLCLREHDCSLDWQKITQQLASRKAKWSKLAPEIPSMDSIPVISAGGLRKVADRRVREHLLKFVNGRRKLVDIADEMGKDPLTVAKSYHPWVTSGWVSFSLTPTSGNISQPIKEKKPQSAKNSSSVKDKKLPMILSVDDSPIVQTSIKRALSDRYNVLLAGKATEALDILNQQPIKLMLLDLTMPDIDGLEFCKSIKQMPKFRDLPVVMVTARDGLVNKMKGHIAGTNKYLTKPFKPEELKAIVSEFVS